MGRHDFTTKFAASVPGWGTKILQTVEHSQNQTNTTCLCLDNSGEVHLQFLNLIATAKTSLTNKVTASGSGGRLWTCLWGHHSDHPRHLLRALSALPAPAPWTLCARFPFQPPGMPTPDATPPPNFWDRDTQNKRVQAPSPHLPGCANLDKSLPLRGEGEGSCCLKEVC